MKYRFSIEAKSHLWDVYSFHKDGQPGTLAFAKIKDRWVIGVFCAGTLNEQEVLGKLEKDEAIKKERDK